MKKMDIWIELNMLTTGKTKLYIGIGGIHAFTSVYAWSAIVDFKVKKRIIINKNKPFVCALKLAAESTL